jgi:peptidoglycan biosynthesis protein MviN/MurJ (putative lipid II flippase)
MILLLTVPLASLLFVMRDSLVFLTLQWGAINTSAANDISGLFGIVLVCAPAVALSPLLQKVAFSRGDMKSPAVTQVILALLIALFVPYAGTVADAKGAV